jgi:RecA/RadA recombinase
MSTNERRAKLMETIKGFNKSQKSEVFTLGNEIEDIPVVPTGIKEFDDKIGGGFKMGGHTIVYGPYSVGKTALILHAVANAQKNGLLVCYVNTEKPIEPERFKFFGINLDELVYIEAPENAEQALEAMRTLCKDKVIDLFIIDSTNGLCPKSSTESKEGQERGLDKKDVADLPATLSMFYRKVNAHVFRAKSAVVWIGQMRTKGIGSYFVRDGLTGGNAQGFYAYQIIRLNRCQKADNPKEKIQHYFLDPDGKMHRQGEDEDVGFGVVAKLEKTNSSKSLKENSEFTLAYYYESGFSQPNTQEEKIVIDGTYEEKAIIRQKLIEKGVLKNDTTVPENNTEPTLIPPTIPVEERKFTKEEIQTLDKPKKRGRPKKENK